MKLVETLENLNQYEFSARLSNKQEPLLITDGIKDWQALHWNPNYLMEKYPHEKVEFSFATIKESEKPYWGDIITLKDLLNVFFNPNFQTDEKNSFDQCFFKCFKSIKHEFNIPSWASSSTDYRIDFFVTSARNILPLHWESNHSFIAQIVGTQTFYLFPPEQSSYLAPAYDSSSYNYSYITNVEKVSSDECSNFKDATPYHVEVSPGQVLFIPAGWWFQTVSKNAGIAINFAWKPKLNECNLNYVLKCRLIKEYFENNYDQNSWLNLSEFQSDLDIAAFLLEKNCIWGAIIFCAIYAKKNLQSFASENYLTSLTYLADEESNHLYKNFDVDELINDLKREHSLIKCT